MFAPTEHLKAPLDEYMAKFPKVRIIRLKERQGLIRARLAGAAAAKGKHCWDFTNFYENVLFVYTNVIKDSIRGIFALTQIALICM